MHFPRLAAILCFSLLLVPSAFAQSDPEPQAKSDAELAQELNISEEEFVDRKAFVNAYEAQDWSMVVFLGEKLTQAHPEEISYWATLGVGYYSKNKLEKALECFKLVDEKSENDLQNKRNIAVVSLELKTNDAAQIAEDTCKLFPKDAELLSLTGKYFYGLKQTDKALQYLEAASDVDLTNIMYLTDLTSKLFKLQKYDEAAARTIKGIEAGAKGSILYVNLILAYYKSNKYDQCIEWANKGYELYKDPLVLYHKVRCLNASGHSDQVLTELNPELLQPYMEFELARAQMMMGCSIDASKTCGTPTPDACCAREGEALSHFANYEMVVEDGMRNTYVVHYGLALALAGKLDAANALLRTRATKNVTKLQGEIAAALAVTAWLTPGRDNATCVRLYKNAIKAQPLLNDMNAVKKDLLWPPRAIAALAEIQAAATPADEKSHKGACGCDLKQKSSPNIFAFILSFIVAGACFIKRKRS